MNVTKKDRAVKTSAWLLYTMIVLEILFMVSPFAAYYYSIYAIPLNLLQQSQYTAWLTMYLLPHFTYSASGLANGLLLASWPLIVTGAVLFVAGFGQIYWSKIMRKGAVEIGLYQSIRHPQYLALAIVGLGASLYWSRFIVIIAFVSMLCLYYYLARLEERICVEKFGQSYRDYQSRTGMFLPQSWEAQWRSLNWQFSDRAWVSGLQRTAIVAAVLGLTIATSCLLRIHVINSLQTDVNDASVIVFLAPVSPATRATVASLLSTESLPGEIAYVAPSSWRVPELGLKRSSEKQKDGGSLDELLHPSTHGNSLAYDEERLNVVLVETISIGNTGGGVARLSRTLNVRPVEFLALNTKAGEIIERRTAAGSQWAGIPVPTF